MSSATLSVFEMADRQVKPKHYQESSAMSNHHQPLLYLVDINKSRNYTSEDVDNVVFKKYINDEIFAYIIISVQTIVAGSVSFVGVVTNILNIIVFVRQGVFSDSSTVSLLGLAVADLLSVATLFWMGIVFCVAVLKLPNLNWEPFDVMYMTAAWPHLIFDLITRGVTALVALERCVCVVFPFKVKSIFTPRCSSASVVCVFAYFILTYLVVFFLRPLKNVFDPKTNRTRLIVVEDPRWQFTQVVLTYGNLFTVKFFCILVVLICTTITISRVKLSTVWRESVSAVNNNDQRNDGHVDGSRAQDSSKKLSSSKMQKEKKLVRMITMVSGVFLISYLPNMSLLFIYSYDRDIRTNGPYRNLAWTMYSIAWCSEAVNSSVNIFIYYNMSSKFKKEFDALFGRSQK